MTKLMLRATDKQREAIASRLATMAPRPVGPNQAPKVVNPTVTKAAKAAFKPVPTTPPAPPASIEPPRALNSFERAGQARRAAEWARRHRMAIVRETLIVRFPAVFKAPGEPRVPLKIGVHHDLVEVLPEILPSASRKDLGRVLALYTGDREYRAVMVEGAARVGLDGQAAGVVTAKDAAAAVRPTKENAP